MIFAVIIGVSQLSSFADFLIRMLYNIRRQLLTYGHITTLFA